MLCMIYKQMTPAVLWMFAPSIGSVPSERTPVFSSPSVIEPTPSSPVTAEATPTLSQSSVMDSAFFDSVLLSGVSTSQAIDIEGTSLPTTLDSSIESEYLSVSHIDVTYRH